MMIAMKTMMVITFIIIEITRRGILVDVKGNTCVVTTE
jgi:hypothetical protein